MNIEIIKEEKLPSTTNGWGFNGSTNKVRYEMSNGDVWISGTAQYRHLPPERYIQARFFKADDPEWTQGFYGSAANDLEVLRKGSVRAHMERHYSKLS